MASPQPAVPEAFPLFYQGGRLGIVNKDKFIIQAHVGQVLINRVFIDLILFRRDLLEVSVQRVVKLFSNRIKVLAAFNDFPSDIQSQFPHQGHHAIQDFGHTAAHGRGVHMQDGFPGQRPRKE